MAVTRKRKPYRQKWQGGIPPTAQHILAGREDFRKRGVLKEIERLASEAGLHPVFTGPRDPRSSTVPRCYLFFSPEAYERRDEWVACIDGATRDYRILIRPFGKGDNRVDLLPRRYVRHFSAQSDNSGWRHMIVQSEEDRQLAMRVVRDIRAAYEAEFDV